MAKKELLKMKEEEKNVLDRAEMAPLVATPYGEISEDLKERLDLAQEALESFDDAKMPPIRFKDGEFFLEEGSEPLSEVEGTIIFTHKSNIYFEKQWRPGQPVEPPRCFSPDGRFPNVENAIHKECKTCPKNQFKSSPTGDGKACRNIRPMFILMKGSIMPRQLRVPPTSLKLVEQYCLGTVADIGSYWCLRTKVVPFQKDQGQTHWNMRFQRGEKLSKQELAEVMAIRALWMPTMKTTVMTQEDLYDADNTSNDIPPGGEVIDTSAEEVKF